MKVSESMFIMWMLDTIIMEEEEEEKRNKKDHVAFKLDALDCHLSAVSPVP